MGIFKKAGISDEGGVNIPGIIDQLNPKIQENDESKNVRKEQLNHILRLKAYYGKNPTKLIGFKNLQDGNIKGFLKGLDLAYDIIKTPGSWKDTIDKFKYAMNMWNNTDIYKGLEVIFYTISHAEMYDDVV